MSFTPTTKVLVASGAAIPISQLKPGEKVLATNTKTGKTRPETIAAVLVNHDTDLYDLKVETNGRTAVINTTSNHPFWIPLAGHSSGRWIKAEGPWTGYPQCAACAKQQGGIVNAMNNERYDFEPIQYYPRRIGAV